MSRRNKFGRALRRRAAALEHRPAAVAEALGVTVNTVRRWEIGDVRPHVDNYKKIAAYLEVELDAVFAMFEEEDEDAPSQQ